MIFTVDTSTLTNTRQISKVISQAPIQGTSLSPPESTRKSYPKPPPKTSQALEIVGDDSHLAKPGKNKTERKDQPIDHNDSWKRPENSAVSGCTQLLRRLTPEIARVRPTAFSLASMRGNTFAGNS